MKIIALLFSLFAIGIGNAIADIKLDKINKCTEIVSLYETLTNGETNKFLRCRAPNSDIERALLNRFKSFLGNEGSICYMRSAPANFLNDFSCTFYKDEFAGKEVFCFKVANANDIQIYKDQYHTKFAPLVQDYLNKSAKCSVSNGDSSISVPTQSPNLLNLIARLELGFQLRLGASGLESTSSTQHGYASVDPEIQDGEIGAIEFFSIFAGGKSAATNIRERRQERRAEERKMQEAGNWNLFIDNNHDLNEDAGFKKMKKLFRNNGFSLFFTSIDINIKSKQDSSLVSASKKSSIIKKSAGVISEILEDEGFEVYPLDEIKRHTGMDVSNFTRMFSLRIPYGMRDMAPSDGKKEIKMMVKEDTTHCRNGEGVLMSAIFEDLYVFDDRADYGSIGFFIIGLCNVASQSTTKYVKNIESEIVSKVIAMLKEN